MQKPAGALLDVNFILEKAQIKERMKVADLGPPRPPRKY
jgi:hypothetical protein